MPSHDPYARCFPAPSSTLVLPEVGPDGALPASAVATSQAPPS